MRATRKLRPSGSLLCAVLLSACSLVLDTGELEYPLSVRIALEVEPGWEVMYSYVDRDIKGSEVRYCLRTCDTPESPAGAVAHLSAAVTGTASGLRWDFFVLEGDDPTAQLEMHNGDGLTPGAPAAVGPLRVEPGMSLDPEAKLTLRLDGCSPYKVGTKSELESPKIEPAQVAVAFGGELPIDTDKVDIGTGGEPSKYPVDVQVVLRVGSAVDADFAASSPGLDLPLADPAEWGSYLFTARVALYDAKLLCQKGASARTDRTYGSDAAED